MEANTIRKEGFSKVFKFGSTWERSFNTNQVTDVLGYQGGDASCPFPPLSDHVRCPWLAAGCEMNGKGRFVLR